MFYLLKSNASIKILFVPYFFSSSQHHVANSFLIPSFLIISTQFAYGTAFCVSDFPRLVFLPATQKKAFCHHDLPSPLIAFSPVDIFLMYAFFFLSFFSTILFASLEAAANVMRYHCDIGYRTKREREKEKSKRDIKMLSSHSLMPLRCST